MKEKIADPIATTSFVLTRPDGTRTPVEAILGRPYLDPDGRGARCPVELRGVDSRYPDIAGSDTMQALLLAAQLLYSRLCHQVEAGSVLTDPESDQPFDLEWLAAAFGQSRD